ncbi:MAG: DUF86 domain-containing protein [Candidatus Pacebacteria bacterium]|nr:DUF86 domain-containing protein [Candidatus Paceibacterota bacterium]
MKKDPEIFLKHIIESAEIIENNIKGITKEKFSKSIIIQDAIIRRIEIIGEAAKNIPADFKKKHKSIEWREIVGMRDKLIHDYFGVNIETVWKTAKEDVPVLKKQIEALL